MIKKRRCMRSFIGLDSLFSTAPAAIAAIAWGVAFASPATAASPDTSAFCDSVAELRSNYGGLNRTVAAATVQSNPDKIEEWDAEEDSCISSYGVDLGFSFTSIASSLLEGLKDAACSVMDDYISDQMNALNSTVTAPLDLAGIDVSFGEQDSPFSMSTSREDIGVDFEKVFRDQAGKLPDVNSGFDYDASNGGSVNDFEYLNTRPSYSEDRR